MRGLAGRALPLRRLRSACRGAQKGRVQYSTGRVKRCRAAMISNGEMVTDGADASISPAIFGLANVAIDQLTSIAAVKAVPASQMSRISRHLCVVTNLAEDLGSPSPVARALAAARVGALLRSTGSGMAERNTLSGS